MGPPGPPGYCYTRISKLEPAEQKGRQERRTTSSVALAEVSGVLRVYWKPCHSHFRRLWGFNQKKETPLPQESKSLEVIAVSLCKNKNK